MLQSIIKEILTAHLARLSDLAAKYRRDEPSWPNEAEKWLEEAEKHLAQFRFPDAGLIAAARGGISKAADTARAGGQSTRRQAEKAGRATSWEAVQEAARLLEQHARQADEKLQTFEDKLCEGLTAYFLHHPAPGETRPQAEDVWQGIKTWDSTKPLALYVEASLGMQDRLYLLHRILSRFHSRTGE